MSYVRRELWSASPGLKVSGSQNLKLNPKIEPSNPNRIYWFATKTVVLRKPSVCASLSTGPFGWAQGAASRVRETPVVSVTTG